MFWSLLCISQPAGNSFALPLCLAGNKNPMLWDTEAFSCNAFKLPLKCSCQADNVFAKATFKLVSQQRWVAKDIWSNNIGNTSSDPLFTWSEFIKCTSFFNTVFTLSLLRCRVVSFSALPSASSAWIFCAMRFKPCISLSPKACTFVVYIHWCSTLGCVHLEKNLAFLVPLLAAGFPTK